MITTGTKYNTKRDFCESPAGDAENYCPGEMAVFILALFSGRTWYIHNAVTDAVYEGE